MKRIITIQDISCVGKCSLTVALPIISAMGVEAAVLPTAVLSTHTAFKGFTFRDLTEDITPICNHWKEQKIAFDAIYTGYLGSFEQLDLMSKMFKDFRTSHTLVFVDPCMADNGKLYPGFTQEFAFAMAKLAGQADVIVPNLTEASYMLGIPYKASGYDEDYVKDILIKLAALGAKKVVVKGIVFDKEQKTFKNVVGKIGIVSYDAQTQKFSSYFHEKLETSFHGTGDIFASVCVGALMRNMSLDNALKLAADYVVESIKATVAHKDYNWYGVDFETVFPFLIKRLEKEAQ
ncbi:MAG: pyridoxamine kinase [Treponema sp.]|nr:pyridoxamine kinase [Treponema sp.]